MLNHLKHGQICYSIMKSLLLPIVPIKKILLHLRLLQLSTNLDTALSVRDHHTVMPKSDSKFFFPTVLSWTLKKENTWGQLSQNFMQIKPLFYWTDRQIFYLKVQHTKMFFQKKIYQIRCSTILVTVVLST